MLTPSMGFCATPLTHHWLRKTGRLENRRNDVDDVVELIANAAGVLDAHGPGHGHAVASAAEMRGHLLGPLIGRIPGPRPAHRVMRVGLVGTPDVVELHVLFHGRVHGVGNSELVEQAVQRALGARAVVAADVDHERVVELADVLDRLDHTADLMVGVRQIRRVDLGLADVELLCLGR